MNETEAALTVGLGDGKYCAVGLAPTFKISGLTAPGSCKALPLFG